jgi:hypothetical protein
MAGYAGIALQLAFRRGQFARRLLMTAETLLAIIRDFLILRDITVWIVTSETR